jgi:hypothetical protein
MDNFIDVRKRKIPQPREKRVSLPGKGSSLEATTKRYKSTEKGFVQLPKE